MVTELFDLSDCGPRDYVYTHTHLDAFGNEYEHTHASLLDSDTDLYRYLHTPTLRVPDARPAADAPGGEHDLADR